MSSMAASTAMEDLRQQLEALVEQLSRLADAKRMYGSVRTTGSAVGSSRLKSTSGEGTARKQPEHSRARGGDKTGLQSSPPAKAQDINREDVGGDPRKTGLEEQQQE
ncbi:hypothetical protein Agub_g9854, partial [Astrephomene gubernaculifera]